ncbi:hypothetical protein MANI_110392 [Metarhizium anisopliae]
MSSLSFCNICAGLDFSRLLSEQAEGPVAVKNLERTRIGRRSEIQNRADKGCPLCKLFSDAPRTAWDVYPWEMPGWDEAYMKQAEATIIPGHNSFEVHFEKPAGEKHIVGRTKLDIYRLDSEDSYFRILRPMADLRTVNSWLKTCLESHQLCCKERWPDSFMLGIVSRARAWFRDVLGWAKPPPFNPYFRLINTKARKIEDIEPSVAVGYATLSYTWGKVIPERPKFRKQRAANNGSTCIPLPKKLPGTIAAAIKLASDIGIEYLWVDSICIDQEDGLEKQVQLANMAEIYGRATVCLVAAAGDNMDFGLPGFSNRRTQDAQSPLYIRGYTLGRGLEHPSNIIEKTYWNTRGWTFQEALLSKRNIVITESEVFYQCIEGCHREANFNRPSLPNVLSFPNEVARTLPHMLLDCHDDSASLFHLYLQCVAKYTSRSLGRASDGLNAFQGVLSHLERHFGSSMLMGLPKMLLASALVWDVREDGTLRRRYRTQDPPELKYPCLPSWTWAAWEGCISWGRPTDYSVVKAHHWADPNWAQDCSHVSIVSDLPMEAGFETLFAHENLEGNPQRYLAGILPMVARVVVWPTSEHQPAGSGRYPGRNLFWVHMCDIRDKDRDVTIYFLVLELFRYRRHRPSHGRLRQLFGPAAADAFRRGPQQKQHGGPPPPPRGGGWCRRALQDGAESP